MSALTCQVSSLVTQAESSCSSESGDAADDGSGEPASSSAAVPEHTRCFQVHLRLLVPDTDPPVTGWLDQQLAVIGRLAHVRAGALSVVLVDDERMRRLHGQYKGRPATTDVLAFDLRDSADDPIEGDLVICLSEAQRQSALRGHEARVEILLYAVHGMLHLLGFDDKSEQAAQAMHHREDELLEAVGIGPVYGRKIMEKTG